MSLAGFEMHGDISCYGYDIVGRKQYSAGTTVSNRRERTGFGSTELTSLLRTASIMKSRSLLFLPAAFAMLVVAGCEHKVEPGFGLKDGMPVYGELIGPRWEGHIIVREVHADPATFQVVSPPANATRDAWTYARDSQSVFIGADTAPYALVDCDPATFEIMTPDGNYAHDATHVYYCGILLKDADPKTFKILAPPYSKDSARAFAGAASIDVLDAATFEVVKSGGSETPFIWTYGPTLKLRDDGTPRTSIWGWARDSKAYYYADWRVEDADRGTFEVLNSIYAKDKDRVYCAHDRKVLPVDHADPNSFQASMKVEAEGQDRNRKFFLGKKVAPGK